MIIRELMGTRGLSQLRNLALADFYPTVKAALRHECSGSEEDREGLGCHLGQGRK